MILCDSPALIWTRILNTLCLFCPVSHYLRFRKDFAEKFCRTLYPEDIFPLIMESLKKWNIKTTTITEVIQDLIGFRANKKISNKDRNNSNERFPRSNPSGGEFTPEKEKLSERVQKSNEK